MTNRLFAILIFAALSSCAPAPLPRAPRAASSSTAAHVPSPGSVQTRPGADTSAFFAYETVKIGEGIYAFIEPEPKTGLVSGNSVAIIGDDGVLVVDTSHFPTLARKMIAEIGRLTDKPVRYVVNTHWHPDHVFGNGAYRAAFPGVVVISQTETRRLLVKNDPKYIDQQHELPTYGEHVRAVLASGKHRDGRPVTAQERVTAPILLAAVESTLADADVELSPPTMTFDRELTIHLGKREIQVMHLGRGNTAGDAVVYVPDAKVLMTGDLVVNPTPYAFGSYLGDWIATLDKLTAIDAQTIVPGHGPIEHDFEYPKTVMSLLASTRAQVQAAAREGLTLEQARAKVDLESFRKRIAGDDPDRRDAFQTGFVEPAVERAYQEAHGSLRDEE